MYEIRQGKIGIAARCAIAYHRWLDRGTGDIEDAPIEAEAGALAEAERGWSLMKICDILGERLPIPG